MHVHVHINFISILIEFSFEIWPRFSWSPPNLARSLFQLFFLFVSVIIDASLLNYNVKRNKFIAGKQVEIMFWGGQLKLGRINNLQQNPHIPLFLCTGRLTACSGVIVVV